MTAFEFMTAFLLVVNILGIVIINMTILKIIVRVKRLEDNEIKRILKERLRGWPS